MKLQTFVIIKLLNRLYLGFCYTTKCCLQIVYYFLLMILLYYVLLGAGFISEIDKKDYYNHIFKLIPYFALIIEPIKILLSLLFAGNCQKIEMSKHACYIYAKEDIYDNGKLLFTKNEVINRGNVIISDCHAYDISSFPEGEYGTYTLDGFESIVLIRTTSNKS